MDAKKISAISIIATITTAVGYVANNPIALQFVANFVGHHPVLAELSGLLSVLALLCHPQPKLTTDVKTTDGK